MLDVKVMKYKAECVERLFPEHSDFADVNCAICPSIVLLTEAKGQFTTFVYTQPPVVDSGIMLPVLWI